MDGNQTPFELSVMQHKWALQKATDNQVRLGQKIAIHSIYRFLRLHLEKRWSMSMKKKKCKIRRQTVVQN